MKTISFYGPCAASGEVTLVSQQISEPFRVVGSRCKFADGCGNKVRLEFLVAPDGDAPASGRPNGASILADYGQVPYVCGNDEEIILHHDVEVPEGNSWVKVYAVNLDFFAHDVLAQVFIEPMPRKEGVT